MKNPQGFVFALGTMYVVGILYVVFCFWQTILSVAALILGGYIGLRVLAAACQYGGKALSRAAREKYRAEVWKQKQVEADKRKRAHREAAKRRKKQERQKVEERCSALYNQVLEKKAERNAIIEEMGSMYQTAKKLESDGAPPAEVNRLHSKIHDLKAKKISLSEEIDELYLKMERIRSNAGS